MVVRRVSRCNRLIRYVIDLSVPSNAIAVHVLDVELVTKEPPNVVTLEHQWIKVIGKTHAAQVPVVWLEHVIHTGLPPWYRFYRRTQNSAGHRAAGAPRRRRIPFGLDVHRNPKPPIIRDGNLFYERFYAQNVPK
jgi:hypothetical protein